MVEFVVAVFAVCKPLLVCAVYCIGLLCFGLCCLAGLSLSRSQCRDMPLSLYLGLAGSLGSGLVATILLILSLIGQFKAATVIGVLSISGLLSVVFTRSALSEIKGGIWGVFHEFFGETLAWRLIALAAIGLVIAHGVSALHPAIGDSVAFYLPWSTIMADTGRVIRLPGYESFSDIWTIAEIEVAALMMVSNDFAARALPFWHVVFAAMLLWGAGGAAGFAFRARVLVIVMLFTSTAVTYIVWDGKTDLVGLPLGLAAIITTALLGDEKNKRYSIVIGLLAGTAIAAKPSNYRFRHCNSCHLAIVGRIQARSSDLETKLHEGNRFSINHRIRSHIRSGAADDTKWAGNRGAVRSHLLFS
jgi:hypothetical protein